MNRSFKVLFLFVFIGLGASATQELPDRISVDYLDYRGDTAYYMSKPYTGTIFDDESIGNTIYERQLVNGLYQMQVLPMKVFGGNYRLFLNDELLIYNGEPFTGIVQEKHENGRVLTEHQWVDGKRDGVWIAWFPSGQLNRTTTFKNGLIHGLQTRWYENGQQKEMHCMFDNKMVGVSKFWDEEGGLTQLVVHDYENKLSLNLGDIDFSNASIGIEEWNQEKLHESSVNKIAGGTSLESRTDFYHFGRFRVDKNLSAVTFAVPHLYGWMQFYYRLYNEESSDFFGEWVMLAGGEGDAGEELKVNSWITDVDGDRSPEIISRAGTTYLEIDAPESERQTAINPIDVFTYDPETSSFVLMTIDTETRKKLESECLIEF